MQTITQDQVTMLLCEAVDSAGLFLPVGKRILLEYLSKEDDGIFETEKSWKSFINDNFVDSGYFVDKPKETTIKKWCYPLKDYQDKFVVQVGKNKFVQVDSGDLEFIYDYNLFYSRNNDFPSCVEITVTAKIKE